MDEIFNDNHAERAVGAAFLLALRSYPGWRRVRLRHGVLRVAGRKSLPGKRRAGFSRLCSARPDVLSWTYGVR
jgi:hypothetical protein